MGNARLLDNQEPTLSIKEFKRRFRPDDPDFVTDQTVKNWITKGKIRGGREPLWFVYANWDPDATANRYSDKIRQKRHERLYGTS